MKDGVPLYKEPKKPREKKLYGIGGWLLFFCVNLTILRPIENGGQLLMDLSGVSDPLQMIMLIAFSVVPLVYGIMVGIRLWLILPNAVKHVKIYLIISLCINLLETGVTALESKGKSPNMLPVVRAIVSVIVWGSYFTTSIRVKNTYFQNINLEEPRANLNGDKR
jgi:hypothetical protein